MKQPMDVPDAAAPAGALLTIAQVCQLAQVSESTIRRAFNDRPPLKRVKFGRAIRIRREDFEAYVKAHTTPQRAGKF